MKLRCLLAAVAVAILCVTPSAWSRTEFFPLEDLRAGMKGIGKTCYQGNKPEEFQVEILGVLRGIGPGSDAVLARFSGGPLEKTGVFEGMSGSPVFIEGKLLGAVAFSWPFAKEAIGGITPIKQMVDTFSEPIGVGNPGPGIILKKSMLWNYMLPAQLRGEDGRAFPAAPWETHLQTPLSSFSGHPLRAISTPLSMAGFSPVTLEKFGPQFNAMGLTMMQGAGASGKPSGIPDSTPLEAGSNIVVPLIRGDMDASAGGTVTHIDGDKVYAFGHLLFNLGNTELPMHKGRVLTVFPSQQSSFKIMETTEPIGAIRQDRNSGIYGILGHKPKMIPVHVQMTTSRGSSKNLKFEVARDRFLMPFLINLTVFNSIVSSERGLGVSTLRVKGKISIKGEQPVELENRFSSDSNSPVSASLSIAVPVHFLLASGNKNLEFEKIDLDIAAVEDDRAAVLDSVRFDRSELRAGEAVNLDILYKKTNGEVVQDSYPVKIPADVTPGPIFVLVADGVSLMSVDSREQGDDFIPRDLTQLIRFINNIRKNDRLYVRIYRREAGAVVKGEGLPALPPSILSIITSARNTGGMSPIDVSPFMEYELPPSDSVVSGSKILALTIKP
jgi:hypothetical protein